METKTKPNPLTLRKPRRYASASALTLGLPTLLLSQGGFAQDEPIVLDTMQIEERSIDSNPNAQPGVPYKAKTSADQRRTKPIAETPATIQVLTKTQIDESGYTDLREILDTVPGITLGTGENGNAFGDRYIIRGQEARSDVFVDGLRDPGMTIRESFAVEQVEVTKGPSSSFAGRGTVGGAINAVTKQASMDYDFTRISTAFGSDKHTRLTLDTNQPLGDKAALRANLLYSYEEVPDRAPAERNRKGIALSGLFQLTDKADLTLDYYNLRADDLPDLGGTLKGDVPNRRPARNVPVYVQEQDFLKSDVDTFTARLNYTFTDNVRLTNLTRYGETDNGYVATGVRASTTGINNPDGVYDTFTLSTHRGWQEVEYFANQTNLFVDTEIAAMKHALVLSVEYADHKVLNGTYDVSNSGQNCITGSGTTLNAWCATNANGTAVNGLNTLMNRSIVKDEWDQDWSIKTTSLAVMDTVDITDKLAVFGGIRYDYYDYELMAYWDHDGDGRGGSSSVLGDFTDDDGFWNGHLGLTYQLTDAGMVYFGYSTARDINGGESDVGTSSGYGGLAVNNVCSDIDNPDPALRGCDPNGSINADPESSEIFELGTKWNLFNERLLLTAAIFQIDKKDVMEGEGYEATGSFNTGENRVQGIEFSLVGQITDRLTAQGGVAFMDAEVLKSQTEENEGKTLSNFADETAFLQLKYAVTDEFDIGAAAKYESEKFTGQPDTAAGLTDDGEYSQPIPSYTVYDLFANYQVNDQLGLRLNVGNVTDKEYYTAGYRSGAFLYKGDALNYRLTMNYQF